MTQESYPDRSIAELTRNQEMSDPLLSHSTLSEVIDIDSDAEEEIFGEQDDSPDNNDPRKKAKRTYWFGTLNNYDEDEVKNIMLVRSVYCVFGKEIAPTTGTPHLHVVWRLGRGGQKSYNQMKRAFPRMSFNYFSQKDFAVKVMYCKKEPNWEERGGEGPIILGQNRRAQGEAMRIRAEEHRQLARDGSFEEIPADIMQRNHIYFDRVRRDEILKKANQRAIEEVEDYPLRNWQAELYESLLEQPDKRKIFWVYDPEGGMGKSWFAEWFSKGQADAAVLLPGKAADMACSIVPGLRTYFFDVPRVSGDKVAWGFIEQLKNGRIFNSKYNSQNIFMPKCHVVVLSNAMPPPTTDTTGFSSDRIKLIDLSPSNFYFRE